MPHSEGPEKQIPLKLLEPLSENVARACLCGPRKSSSRMPKLEGDGYTSQSGNIHVLFTGHWFLMIHRSKMRLCS